VQRPKGPAGDVARTFGERVRTARQEILQGDGRKLSQEGLADRAALHRTYVGHVERGEVNVALFNIVRLAQALEVDPADLVGGLKILD